MAGPGSSHLRSGLGAQLCDRWVNASPRGTVTPVRAGPAPRPAALLRPLPARTEGAQ